MTWLACRFISFLRCSFYHFFLLRFNIFLFSFLMVQFSFPSFYVIFFVIILRHVSWFIVVEMLCSSFWRKLLVQRSDEGIKLEEKMERNVRFPRNIQLEDCTILFGRFLFSMMIDSSYWGMIWFHEALLKIEFVGNIFDHSFARNKSILCQ